jgi:hypothetical protein
MDYPLHDEPLAPTPPQHEREYFEILSTGALPLVGALCSNSHPVQGALVASAHFPGLAARLVHLTCRGALVDGADGGAEAEDRAPRGLLLSASAACAVALTRLCEAVPAARAVVRGAVERDPNRKALSPTPLNRDTSTSNADRASTLASLERKMARLKLYGAVTPDHDSAPKQISCLACGALQDDANKLTQCGKCRCVSYCGRECQSQVHRFHKRYCSDMRFVRVYDTPEERRVSRGAYQLTVRDSRKFSAMMQKGGSMHELMRDMGASEEKLASMRQEAREKTAAEAAQALGCSPEEAMKCWEANQSKRRPAGRP